MNPQVQQDNYDSVFASHHRVYFSQLMSTIRETRKYSNLHRKTEEYLFHSVRVMANAVPHTLFQWSLSCLQFIILFLSFMGTLLSYYTLVFRFTLLSSPCVGSSYISARTYTVPYSVSGLPWYQRQSLAPFWLSSRLLVLRSTVLSPIPSTVPVTERNV